MASKPIFALSLIGGEITCCTGLEKDGEIHFVKLENITGRFGKWKKVAAAKLVDAKARGWHVMIDDMTSQFTGHGLTIDLGSVDPVTGRTFQNIALDQYMARAGLGIEETRGAGEKQIQIIGSLVFVGMVGNAAIRPNAAKINIDYDDNGRARYDIDGGLSSKERAMMLVVLGITGTTIHDEHYAKELFSAIEAELDQTSEPQLLGDVNSTIATLVKQSQSTGFARDICE
jgi:hypothetical protein